MSENAKKGRLFVTPESLDPYLNKPYIDVEEWRDSVSPPRGFLAEITTQPVAPWPHAASHKEHPAESSNRLLQNTSTRTK